LDDPIYIGISFRIPLFYVQERVKGDILNIEKGNSAIAGAAGMPTF
jgi:hypothetical protein